VKKEYFRGLRWFIRAIRGFLGVKGRYTPKGPKKA